MSAPNPWPTIHAERQALADDVAGLADTQWSTASLCGDWTVQDMLGHMIATAKMTPSRFLGKFAGAGFNFDKMANKDVKAETAGGPAATLAEWRHHLDDSTSPPGPIDSMLGEIVIHSEDIRRPLGITHTYPMDSVVRLLDFYKKSNLLIGAKSRIAGLSLKATDADWSTGSGAEVSGPSIALLLAMTGRGAALDELSGDGVAALRSRMP